MKILIWLSCFYAMSAFASSPTIPSYATSYTDIQHMSSGWNGCTQYQLKKGPDTPSNITFDPTPVNYPNSQNGILDTTKYCTGVGEAYYTMTRDYSGYAAKFTVTGGPGYNGMAMWWNHVTTAKVAASHFVVKLDRTYLDDPNRSLGGELAILYSNGSKEFKFAVECNYHYGIYRTWDNYNRKWVATTAPCTRPAVNSTQHIALETAISSGQLQYIAVYVNGTRYALGKYSDPKSASGTSVGVHFQMNAYHDIQPWRELVDNFNLYYW